MPLGLNSTIDYDSYVNNNTYLTNPGVSMAHIVNGAAGNGESHSTLGDKPLLQITDYLDQSHYGFGKLTVHNTTALSWKFIHGDSGVVGDYLKLFKKDDASSCSAGSNRSADSSTMPAKSATSARHGRWRPVNNA